MRSLFKDRDESMSEDSLEFAIAHLVYNELLKENKTEKYINWESVSKHYHRILDKIKRERIETLSNQTKEKMRQEGWIISFEVRERFGEGMYDFIRRAEPKLLQVQNVRMYPGDSYGNEFYLLDEINNEEKMADIHHQYLDAPHYSTHQAAEKLGITAPKFSALAKKAGIEPSGHYFTRNGRGNLYSINQFNAIKDFHENPKPAKPAKPAEKPSAEKKETPTSFEELLESLETELKELQDRRDALTKQGKSSSHLSISISGVLNRIAEIEKFQYVLPEISQRLRAWRGNRGLKEAATILESVWIAEFGPRPAYPPSEIGMAPLARIEQGHIDSNREKNKELVAWLQNYLISNAHTYEFEFQKEAQFNDFPMFSTHQAAEQIGITAPTFLSWAKKAGVKKPAGHYHTANGTGNLYSINQFNTISEFYKKSKK